MHIDTFFLSVTVIVLNHNDYIAINFAILHLRARLNIPKARCELLLYRIINHAPINYDSKFVKRIAKFHEEYDRVKRRTIEYYEYIVTCLN